MLPVCYDIPDEGGGFVKKSLLDVRHWRHRVSQLKCFTVIIIILMLVQYNLH